MVHPNRLQQNRILGWSLIHGHPIRADMLDLMQHRPTKALNSWKTEIQNAVLAKIPTAMDQDDVPERISTLGRTDADAHVQTSDVGKIRSMNSRPTVPSSSPWSSSRSTNRANPFTGSLSLMLKGFRQCSLSRWIRSEGSSRRGRGRTPWNDGTGRGPVCFASSPALWHFW